LGSELLAQSLAQRGEGCLGLAVADGAGRGHSGVDRGDVHDGAAPVEQAGQRRAGCPDRAEHVEVEQAAPLLIVGVEEAGEAKTVGVAGADVVDEDVDAAQFRYCRRGDGLGSLAVDKSADTARAATVFSSGVIVRAAPTSRTPSFVSALVTARPMPRPAPVTTAVLSASWKSMAVPPSTVGE